MLTKLLTGRQYLKFILPLPLTKFLFDVWKSVLQLLSNEERESETSESAFFSAKRKLSAPSLLRPRKCWGRSWDHANPSKKSTTPLLPSLSTPLPPLLSLNPVPGLSVGSRVDRVFLFSPSPTCWLGLLLGVDSASLAGWGETRKRARKGNGRRDEIAARVWVALSLGLLAGVHWGPMGNLIPAEALVTWGGDRLHGRAPRHLGSHHRFPLSS